MSDLEAILGVQVRAATWASLSRNGVDSRKLTALLKVKKHEYASVGAVVVDGGDHVNDEALHIELSMLGEYAQAQVAVQAKKAAVATEPREDS